MLAIYHNAPEGHAGSGTSDDLNQFRIFSAAFKWTLNQVGVCWHQQTPELKNNRRLFARWRTGRKTGRDSEWQAKNVERQLIISHQEPVHASEVIITTCSLCISINELPKKKTKKKNSVDFLIYLSLHFTNNVPSVVVHM